MGILKKGTFDAKAQDQIQIGCVCDQRPDPKLISTEPENYVGNDKVLKNLTEE